MSCVYSIVIPAFNEERTIERAIRETKTVFDEIGEPYEVIVSDDGSRDRTAEIVAVIPSVRLVRSEMNRGKGAAVRSGVLASTGDVVLFLDADLATQPSEFQNFLPHLATHDVLFGSRRIEGAKIVSQQPDYRVRSGQIFNFIVRYWLGIPSRDTQCGFKVFRGCARELFQDVKSEGWTFDVEVLLLAQRRGLRLEELPVTWTHGNESRVRFRDAARIIFELVKIKLSSRP